MRFVRDAGYMNEIEASIARSVKVSGTTLREGLAGMEALLADPPKEPNVLRNLIAIEVGLGLDDDSDEGAKVFLRELVEVVRRYVPPRAARPG